MGEISTSRQEPSSPELKDTDIWGSDEEFIPQIPDSDFYGDKSNLGNETSEIAAIRRIHAKQGYLDGLSTSKEESLQKGFDDGYPEGANLGLQVGRIVGTLQMLCSKDGEVGERAKEMLETSKKELNIRKVLNRRYFTEDLKLPEGGHALLKRWSQDIESLVQQSMSG